MNKRLSTKEIEKKAAIETTKRFLIGVGVLLLVLGVIYFFPKLTGVILMVLILIALILLVWGILYIGVEQDIRHKEWDNWRRS